MSGYRAVARAVGLSVVAFALCACGGAGCGAPRKWGGCAAGFGGFASSARGRPRRSAFERCLPGSGAPWRNRRVREPGPSLRSSAVDIRTSPGGGGSCVVAGGALGYACGESDSVLGGYENGLDAASSLVKTIIRAADLNVVTGSFRLRDRRRNWRRHAGHEFGDRGWCRKQRLHRLGVYRRRVRKFTHLGWIVHCGWGRSMQFRRGQMGLYRRRRRLFASIRVVLSGHHGRRSGSGGTAGAGFIGFGANNSIDVGSSFSTVGGGTGNWSTTGAADFVGGGYNNAVAIVCGTIAGRLGNTLSGEYGAIGGGFSNQAVGEFGVGGGGVQFGIR